jgi:predicted transcriptional regulator
MSILEYLYVHRSSYTIRELAVRLDVGQSVIRSRLLCLMDLGLIQRHPAIDIHGRMLYCYSISAAGIWFFEAAREAGR